jgi:hypothetical protein
MNATIARVWRGLPVSADDWERDGTQVARPGEAGGFWMKCTQTGRFAWAKPATNDPGQPRAAREKIASDLAHELGLSVPPVLLHRLPSPNDSSAILPICLSLACYPKQHQLGDLFDCSREDGGTKPALHQFFGNFASLSEIAAFDAWLANEDRGEQNILLGYEERPGAAGELLFVDFAYSMRWDSTTLNTFGLHVNRPFYRNYIKREATVQAAEKISKLPDEEIHAIVDRIPNDFIAEGARRLLVEGVISRKNLLCGAFTSWYPGA